MAGGHGLRLLLLLAVLAAASPGGGGEAERAPPALFVFGDSLIDSGNNNNLASLAKANYFPYGIDFAAGPTGRFCNGYTIVDELGTYMSSPIFNLGARGFFRLPTQAAVSEFYIYATGSKSPRASSPELVYEFKTILEKFSCT